MELKSKTKLLYILFGFFAIFFSFAWLLIFSIIIFGSSSFAEGLSALPFLGIPFFLMVIFSSFLKSYTLNDKEIILKKIVFIKVKSYLWKDFDYFITTIETGKGGASEVLYLVKNKNLKIRISSGNYKNFYEMKRIISKFVENKGFFEFRFNEAFNAFVFKGKKMESLP